ncbi:efflux RND transporter permease subunit, partial [Akkermansia sp.]
DKMDELSKDFPPGVSYQIPYETTHFVEISIQKVVSTLLEAIGLVFLVMFLFLQNFRATLIPTLVVPVALLGTFAVMWISGFSVNMLTMFGMVLSIGILVDDAIVVVENVERIMQEEGLDARQATIKAMKQIGGAIVGITAVLVSVFIPMAFFSGAVGNIYRQFSVTLIVSISFSAFLALSLTPALCAAMLKPSSVEHQDKRGFFGWFNRTINRSTERYGKTVSGIIRRPVRSLFVYVLVIAGAGYLYLTLPSSFLPEEDQGSCMVLVSLPPGTLQEETSARLRDVEDYLMKNEPVKHVYSVGGFSFFGSGTNMAMLFVGLKDWSERTDPALGVGEIVNRINGRFMSDPQMFVLAMNVPALPELGNSSGFDFRLQDHGAIGYERLVEAREELLSRAAADPSLADVHFMGQADTPRLDVSIDRDKAFSMGVPMTEISNSLAVMFGSSYVGDFMHGSQVRRIIIQADGKSRLSGDDIEDLHVRNEAGSLLPLSSFVDLEWTAGPPQLTRYNNYPSFTINGSAAPGKSSGDAMKTMERIASSLPPGIGFEWTGQSYEEQQAGSQASLLFGLSILIVFLVLAALYESWSIPFAVILVVPLGLIGALLAVFLRDMPNDIYFKVGLITTIGLSAKNAILIVEVAKELYRDGMGIMEATVTAAKLRLRPILMTSLAFGAGVIPLAFARGAGAGAQQAVGTGVLGGIITATVLAVFLVPLFFRLTAGKKKKV